MDPFLCKVVAEQPMLYDMTKRKQAAGIHAADIAACTRPAVTAQPACSAAAALSLSALCNYCTFACKPNLSILPITQLSPPA
jgi:hypothetical protein